MQSAGDLVATATELAARVQDGMDDLEGALSRRVATRGNTTPVIDDLDAAVGADGDVDPRRDVGHRLVDAVVDDFPDQLV